MVRLLLFFTAILIIPIIAKGQVTVSVDPSPFVISGNPTETDIIFHVNVINTGEETEHLYWSRRITSAPVQWISWICDNTTCYGPEHNSNPQINPNVVAPGDTMEIQIHLNPVQTEGTSGYDINVLDAEGNVIAVAEGEVIISNTTAVKEVKDLALSVYPNPTTDFFQVNGTPGLKSIELFNIIGNKVRSFNATPQKQYYVGDLNDGIYLVRMVSASNKVLKTIRLSKR